VKLRGEAVRRRPDLVLGRDRRRWAVRLQGGESSRQLGGAAGDEVGPVARRGARAQRVEGRRAIDRIRPGFRGVGEETQTGDGDDTRLEQGLEKLPISARCSQGAETLALGEVMAGELGE